jgi:hypothetical protein
MSISSYLKRQGAKLLDSEERFISTITLRGGGFVARRRRRGMI